MRLPVQPIQPRLAGASALAALLALAPATPLAAQGRDSVRILREGPATIAWSLASPNRAVLGVTLATASRADTAGVRIEAVDADGPAARAGLAAGEVITAINGVTLRVSADDADDPRLAGLGQRRLQRALAAVKPGDAVTLRVLGGGRERTVSVTTVSAAELAGRGVARGLTVRPDSAAARRAALGLTITATGTLRDTLGLFVSAVTPGGPAERAGVVEGDRIAAINGVDVRVPREDVDDVPAASARASRFTRELRKLAPGDTATVRVWAGGRYREVAVTTVPASALPSRGLRFMGSDGRIIIGDLEELPLVVRPMLDELRSALDRWRPPPPPQPPGNVLAPRALF